MNKNKFPLTDLLLIFVSFLWGVNTTVMKVGYKYISPFSFNISRLYVALVCSWIVVYFTGTYKRIEKSDIRKLLSVCLIGFGLLQFCITIGINNSPAGSASLILALLPISVVIINWMFKLEQITKQSIVGIIFSFLGVLFIITGSGKGFSMDGGNLIGILFLLASQFCFAYYMVFSKALLEKYSIYLITAYAMTVSTIVLSIVHYNDIILVKWTAVEVEGWMTILYSGILGLVVGNILWSWGIKRVGSTRTSVYNNLPPVFTIISGYVMLGELLGIVQLFGALFIFTGLYITRMKKNTKYSIVRAEGKDL